MQHRRSLSMAFTLLALLSIIGTSIAFAAPSAQQSTPPTLYLKAGSFTPAAGQAAALPPGLAIAGQQAGANGYYIVQYGGPILQEWQDSLVAAGAEILGYLPDFAYKVRINPGQFRRLAGLPGVVWTGDFQPAFKLSPDLAVDGVHLYRVRVERGANAGLTQAAIATSGADVIDRDNNILLVAADASQVAAIAQVADVAWVENFMLQQKHNETGAGVIVGTAAANQSGYDGSTQIAAVADTGLGGGTAATAHPDIPASRVAAIYDWPSASVRRCYTAYPNGAMDEESGHGTHTAVSVVGDGDGAGNLGRGGAPAARLVFQSTEDFVDMTSLCAAQYADGYYLLGLPDNLGDLYLQAYNAGARVHSNSWGAAVAGDYTLDSANTDAFVRSHPDMLITFSAGNEGTDANADGIIDNDSIGSPATAKNVLTVGASENQRADNYPCDTTLTYQSHDAYQPNTTCTGMGGQNLLGTYGQRWAADYPANPIAGDLSAGNKEQMAAFSSRGPADDSRIKPDVVAPGTWVLSGYSNQHREGYGGAVDTKTGAYQMDGWGMPVNSNYKYFGGTSMSNPIAAGAAVVVRDYYAKARGVNASAALVKATLINSAVDLLDENNDGANDNDYPIPNAHEGWGRINVADATDGSASFVDQATGLATGGAASFNYEAGGAPFKVTLVWSDSASTETAAINLVNDLDLIVTSPSGTVYRGNVFANGWSQAGGSADRRNNVENVYISSAQAGTWTVQVSGYNVPAGPQPFALVVEGASGAVVTATPTATATSAPVSTATPTVTPTPTATATPAASSVLHIGDLDGSKTSKSGRWNATVTITVHTSTHVAAGGVSVSGNWSGVVSGGGTCTTDASGRCSITKSNIRNAGTATFTVTGISATGATYNAAANHDPDGDSNGTAISITYP